MRLKRLRSWLMEQGADGVIITGRKNIHYYSGFRGSSGILVVSAKGEELITDFRYISQAAVQAPDWAVRQCTGSPYNGLAEFLQGKLGKWYFEGHQVSFFQYQSLPAEDGRTYESCDLDFLRQIKSPEEIEKIRKAAQIADRAFGELLKWLTPGKKEREIQIFLDYKMLECGAERTSFPTIVGSGSNGALPHAVPGEREIQVGDLVVIDFGAVYEGYCSDETRTISMGKAGERQKEIYQIVLKAQLAGLVAVRAGALNTEVDQAARKLIEDAGYGEQFGHGLGHGVGLEIHEEPRFSPSAEPMPLAENMVMTVEPGIYLPEWGGIRIEDLVVVKKEGCEILSSTTKELIEIF
jgi:Xaa-Pro aminopeptidase